MSNIFAMRCPDDLSSARLELFLPHLTDFQRHKIQFITDWQEIVPIFYSDILLRTVLCRGLNVYNDELILRRSLSGLPFVFNEEPLYVDVAFNQEWIVCCLHYNNPVTAVMQKNDVSLDFWLTYELSERNRKIVTDSSSGAKGQMGARYCAIKRGVLKLFAGEKSYSLKENTVPFPKKGILSVGSPPVKVYYHFYNLDEQTLFVLLQPDNHFSDFYRFNVDQLLDRFQQVL